MKHFIASEDDVGVRLDVFVAKRMPELSRAHIQKLCDMGKIKIDGHEAKSSSKIKLNNKVEAESAEPGEAPDLKLPVIYEDDDCMVVDKPVGVLTHSKGAFNPEATVATFIASHLRDMQGERAGIVHRLDRGTSGVIICAKNREALKWLQKQFSTRKVKKTYKAIVQGHLKQTKAIIDMPITRNPKKPQVFKVSPNGKHAITIYSVVSESPDYSLVELKPQTGRTHQLRVHMAHLGHPIAGDSFYGGQTAERLFLHAQALEITLPSGERKTFTSKLPKVFNEKINQHG